jgi:hypothetical protein
MKLIKEKIKKYGDFNVRREGIVNVNWGGGAGGGMAC